jgi:hypothetical protein
MIKTSNQIKLILIIGGVLSLSICSLFTSCGPKVSQEKQVLDMVYSNLIAKTEELQETSRIANRTVISWHFITAINEANRESLVNGDIGDSIKVNYDFDIALKTEVDISTWTGALKKLATQKSNGIWKITISDWEFEFDEATNILEAKNIAAVELFQELESSPH